MVANAMNVNQDFGITPTVKDVTATVTQKYATRRLVFALIVVTLHLVRDVSDAIAAIMVIRFWSMSCRSRVAPVHVQASQAAA